MKKKTIKEIGGRTIQVGNRGFKELHNHDFIAITENGKTRLEGGSETEKLKFLSLLCNKIEKGKEGFFYTAKPAGFFKKKSIEDLIQYLNENSNKVYSIYKP